MPSIAKYTRNLTSDTLLHEHGGTSEEKRRGEGKREEEEEEEECLKYCA